MPISFPIFGTGGLWKAASGSGTPADPFVPAVNITGGGGSGAAQTPWAQNIDGAGFTLSNAAVRWVTASGVFAGSNAGNATALIEGVNNLTGADGVKGAVLPTPTSGRTSFVIVNNNTFTAIGLVYPQTTGSINGQAANAPWYVPPGVTVFWSNGGANAAWVAQGQNTNGVAPTFTHANSPVGTPLTAVANVINPVDTSGGTVAVQLPNPATTQGVIFQDSAGRWEANNFSVIQNASEKIGGTAATLVCNGRGAFFVLASDGTNWNLPITPTTPSVRAVASGTTDTVLIGDVGGKIIYTHATNNFAVTIPANATTKFPPKSKVLLQITGTGTATLVAATGVTIKGWSPNNGALSYTSATATNLKTPGQYAAIVIEQDATTLDTWYCYGAP